MFLVFELCELLKTDQKHTFIKDAYDQDAAQTFNQNVCLTKRIQ